MVRAGAAKNVIPASGEAAGTVRMLDAVAWADAEDLIRELIAQIVAPYGVGAEVSYVRGVPPVVNEPASTRAARRGGRGHARRLQRTCRPPQSLGGEDFAWYLDRSPGRWAGSARARPGGPTYDLHQGDLRVDERATAIGSEVLAAAALEALVPSR